jgi:hypothetical protein
MAQQEPMATDHTPDARAPAPPDPLAWLARAEREGVSRAEALAVFDALPPVAPAEMRGRWRGSGVPTGHRLDGLLEAYGWAGKAFADDETAHPLLFARAGASGAGAATEWTAIDPRRLPPAGLGATRLARSRAAVWAFRLARPLLATRQPQARLRLVEHRGVLTAAMIYDRQPIIDLFRRVGPGVLLGLMDMRGEAAFFFALREAG